MLLSPQYRIQDGVVYWRHHPLPKANPATFQHLGGSWARDDRAIYVHHRPKKIDVATFEYLNPVFVKDAKSVYDWEGAIAGADVSTFEVLDPGIVVEDGQIETKLYARGYARDSQAVYFHDQMFGRAAVVKGADSHTFVSLRNGYGYDAKSVWHDKSKLPKSDPRTWVYLGRYWSMDRNRMYFVNREVPGIDRDGFTIVGAPTIVNLATDGVRFFRTDDPIEEEQFWAYIDDEYPEFRNWTRVMLLKIRGRCVRCNGSGKCYCQFPENSAPTPCKSCRDTGKCSDCQGTGKVERQS